MTVPVSKAISAYQNIPKVGEQDRTAGRVEGETPDFGGMVKNAVQGVVDQQKAGERMSMAAIAGKADLNEVVTAVAEAEIALQAAVTIRNKVIEAYKEIARMPI